MLEAPTRTVFARLGPRQLAAGTERWLWGNEVFALRPHTPPEVGGEAWCGGGIRCALSPAGLRAARTNPAASQGKFPSLLHQNSTHRGESPALRTSLQFLRVHDIS